MAKHPSRRRRVPTAPQRLPPGLTGHDAVIGIAAFALRVLYVLSVRHAPFFSHLQTEPLRYEQWASLILQGAAPTPPFEQSPGYPYVVATVYLGFGHSLTALALVQAALDAVTCVLISVAARRWFNPRAGVIAGVLAAVYGPFIYFTGELLPATAFVFIVTQALTTTLMRLPRPALAGTLWALALLIRAEVVLAWPLVLVDAWQRGGRRALQRTVIPLLLVVVLSVGLNVAYGHRLVWFTTSGGVNLWLGNNAQADGVNPFVFGPLERVAASVRAAASTAAEADQLFTQQAFAFWRQQPGQAAGLLWKKLVWTWTNRELPNSTDIDWQIAQSWVFRLLFLPLSFGVVFPLSVAGALLLGRQWRSLPLLAAPIAVGVGTSLLFFTNARFRLVMIPSLLILAAVAIDRVVERLPERRQHRHELGLAAVGIGVGLLVAWGNFFQVRTYRVPQISVNTGALEREAGQLDAAVRHLREGLADNPRDAIGWVHLALALEQQGQIKAAGDAYRDALALMPDDPTLRDMANRFVQRNTGAY